MSRLDSVIRRLTAQRICLGHVADLIASVPGPVLELGLGNGRTYDHLREILPEREIFAFDAQVTAHPKSTPDDDHLILGDFSSTLPNALSFMGAPAALAHADFGSTGDEAVNKATSAFLSQVLQKLMAPGGVIVSDQVLELDGWSIQPLPEGVLEDRYFILRA
ncbi:MAG: hypothetical protein HOL66_07155 [Rhodospirillaceae bacterium]|jgi:hypothetical protein|nr:hypothetical protein [Rhodospirillaceae bacterium]MBT5244005.1 hypothetical protein [Rhodospirillaceae bacterium]MBT5560825.1 hypothetical protein [Rhodospirillaceae bacterium]MBT6240563.1 hypothetical protein [Rhodospirillaceae bacterium]MBT7138367.1 hypothetical protein [Rhodospirillaceae bacterium]